MSPMRPSGTPRRWFDALVAQRLYFTGASRRRDTARAHTYLRGVKVHADAPIGEHDMSESDSEKQFDEAMQDTPAAPGNLEAQLAAARAEAEQYKDKYLREYADKENYRKR